MDKVLIVAYGSRDSAIADVLYRSDAGFSLYFADKQKNPFNLELARKTKGKHVVIPDLSVTEIYDFAKGIEKLRFVICGSEGPVVDGITDQIEDGLEIPVIAPRRKYAIEGSKAKQRKLIQHITPEASPDFEVFEKSRYPNFGEAWPGAKNFMRRHNYNVVLKPVRPASGKGVMVYGDHFQAAWEAKKLFKDMLESGGLIVEEKLEGEESSFMAFCDGKRIFPLPETRDYKRAFDGDKGPNTGGMGSYMDSNYWLPFMTENEWKKEVAIMEKIFNRMKGKDYEPGLKGMPFYVAFMHTKEGPKILEINSRPGDPEIMNILPALETDFGEICLGIIEGNLKEIKMKPLASVVTYLVPPTYGGKESEQNFDRSVNMKPLNKIVEDNDMLRAYPGSMELGDDGKIYMLKSRALAVVGMEETIEDARIQSTKAADLVSLTGGELWRRSDIASESHIQKSIEHMKELRSYAK